MPRARSRSSFSASWASSPAWRTSSAAPGSPASDALLGHAQVQRERHEPLLRAVVQVALDPPPLGVRRGDDARARVLELVHLGGERGVGVRAEQLAGEPPVQPRERVQARYAEQQDQRAERHGGDRARASS